MNPDLTRDVSISADVLARYGVIKIAYLIATGVTVNPTPPREKKLARKVESQLRASLQRDALEDDAILRSWIELAREMGIDSPEEQPAQLQLIARILKLRDIPKINSVVDAANITAAEYRSPVGVFDLAKIEGSIRLRLAQPGETMTPLFADTALTLTPGEIVYADDQGVFSRYSKDADRTRISDETHSVFAVVDGTGSVSLEHLVTARASLQAILEDASGPDVVVTSGVARQE